METNIPQSVEMTLQARIGRPSYFEALIRHGYKRFGVYNRHYSPLGYSDPSIEYNELLNGVVLWPVAQANDKFRSRAPMLRRLRSS